MSRNKDWLRGPSSQDHAKEAIWQGAWMFGICALTTLGMWLFLGFVWVIIPIIAVVGFFRLLYGLISFYTGWE